MIKKNDFQNLGMFDEDIFLFGEENILSLKLKKNNKKVFLLKNTKYKHIHSKSINKEVSLNKKFSILRKSLFIYHTKYLNINLFNAYFFYFFGRIISACFVLGQSNYCI
jgi:GT2 family glycosyltransferase